MTSTLGRWRAAVALALALPASLGMMAGPAGATTPCPPMEYSVAYAAPVWSVTVLNDLPWRLDGMWYWSPWNGSYESLADHVDRPAGEVERVTLQDRDGSGNLSRSDEIQAWDGPRGLQMLQLAVGPNASALGMQWGIRLEDGYRFLCLNAGSGVDLVTLGAVVGMGGAVVAVLLVAVWRPGRRDRRSRR